MLIKKIGMLISFIKKLKNVTESHSKKSFKQKFYFITDSISASVGALISTILPSTL